MKYSEKTKCNKNLDTTKIKQEENRFKITESSKRAIKSSEDKIKLSKYPSA